jgi:glutathione S-transferase
MAKILTESCPISQFLVDAHPSHLAKTSSGPGGDLQRFQIGFFVDMYLSKAHSHFHGFFGTHGAHFAAIESISSENYS